MKIEAGPRASAPFLFAVKLMRIVEGKNKVHEKPGHQNGRNGQGEQHRALEALGFA